MPINTISSLALQMSASSGECGVDCDGERAALGDKSEPTYLRFRNQQDALDFANGGIQHRKRWNPDKFRHFAERYIKGELEIVLEIPAGPDHAEYHFVFFKVPDGSWNAGVPADKARLHRPKMIAEHRSTEDAVLTVVAEPIQCPNGFVPSLVRLERAKQREDIRWEILASPASYHISFELGRSVSNWEVGAFRLDNARKNGSDIPRLIKCGSEIFR
jgi:hypothetical protein